MDCDEFWERWADIPGDQKALAPAMEEHLKACSRCSRELSVFQQGLDGLRREINEEQSARFWHGLRQEVRAGIKIPKRRFQWDFSWQKLGWVAAGVFLLAVIFKGTLVQDPSLQEEDIILLTGVDPIAAVYVEPELSVEYEDDEMTDSDFYRGITDVWTALLDQAVEKAVPSHGNGYYPGKAIENSGARGRDLDFNPHTLKG